MFVLFIMVQFNLGTLNYEEVLAILPQLDTLTPDLDVSGGHILAKYTWYCNKLDTDQTDCSAACDASGNGGAGSNSYKSWRRLFRFQMDASDMDDLSANDILFETNKDCWVTSTNAVWDVSGETSGTCNPMQDFYVGDDPKSSISRAALAGTQEDGLNAGGGGGTGGIKGGIGPDFLFSLANQAMGLSASGRGSYNETAIGTFDIFTNEVALKNMATNDQTSTTQIGGSDNFAKRLHDQHQILLENSHTAGQAGLRDSSSNICARVFDQLLMSKKDPTTGAAGERSRISSLLKTRSTTQDYMSLLKAKDVIFFNINMQPSYPGTAVHTPDTNASDHGASGVVNVDEDTNDLIAGDDNGNIHTGQTWIAAPAITYENVVYQVKITLEKPGKAEADGYDLTPSNADDETETLDVAEE